MEYKMFQHKPLEFGFVVICPNCNMQYVKTTLNSLAHGYKSNKRICVIPGDCSQETLLELNKLCPTYQAGKTIASLVNLGLKKADNEWIFIISAGLWIGNLLDRKFSFYIKSEKDILFPITRQKTNFVDSDLSGTLLHKNAFKEIGGFGHTESFPESKMDWAFAANAKGYQFKGINILV